MKNLLLGLLFAASSASSIAGPKPGGIDNMVAQCRCVMEGGECRVSNGPKAPPGSKVYTSSGPIPAAAYNAIRSKGGLMCQEGKQACTGAWDGDECRAFRLMFRQEPTVCVPGA